MNAMFHVAQLQREKFLSWIGGMHEPHTRPVGDFDEAAFSDIVLAWDREPFEGALLSRPPIIAIQGDFLTDFLAFAGTYISTYQPFTAFFRVVPIEMLSMLVSPARHKMRKLSKQSFFAGAIIAEARLQSGDRVRKLSDITIQAGMATLSAAVVTALNKGFDISVARTVMINWRKTRSILSSESLRVDPDRICNFWEAVYLAHEGNISARGTADTERAARFLREVMSNPDDTDPPSWLSLLDIPSTQNILGRMRDSREDRVRAMDDAVASVAKAKHLDVQLRELVTGYLASRVAGGSMSYLDILMPLEAELPLATMWFGLFCSLRNENDVLLAGDCLGRRIARRISQKGEIFSAPVADISLAELDVFRPGLNLRTEHQNVIEVEIFPGISSSFRQVKNSKEVTEPMSYEVIGEAQYLIERAGRLLGDFTNRQGSLGADRLAKSRYNPRTRRDR